MIKHFLELIDSLKTNDKIDPLLLNRVTERIKKGKLVKAENEVDHFCSFLVPVHKETKSIYVGHHIKADEWIPPGGHIEIGESPEDTVRREFTEELSSTLKNELIELFDISITNVFHPSRPCRVHNDFWFAVYMDKKTNFKVDTKEFHEAEWLVIDDAIGRAKRPSITTSLAHLRDLLS